MDPSHWRQRRWQLLLIGIVTLLIITALLLQRSAPPVATEPRSEGPKVATVARTVQVSGQLVPPAAVTFYLESPSGSLLSRPGRIVHSTVVLAGGVNEFVLPDR